MRASLISILGCLALGACDEPPPPAAPHDGGAPSSSDAWSPLLEGAPQGLILSVWGRGADDVYLVGGQPGQTAVARWDGAALRWEPPLGHARAWWVFGFHAPAVTYVVGERGLGLVERDGRWSPWRTEVEDATLFGVWGSAPSDLWVVGGDMAAGDRPILRHWDGRKWRDAVLPPLGSPPPVAFFKVWGEGPGELLVAGDRGVMLRYDGAVWSRVPAPPADAILTVHGRAADEAWAVGGRARGLLWQMQAGRWRDRTPAAGLGPLAGVFAAPDGSLLAVGNRGLILERDPTGTWSTPAPVTRDFLHGAWIAPDGTRWAVGGDLLAPAPNHGVILRGPPPTTAPPPPPPPPEPGTCAAGWLRGAGEHRLYLQGREAEPDPLGRYPLLTDRAAVVHGEHYLMGAGAFTEWSLRLCGPLAAGDLLFYLPNNDDVGSRALHQLFLVHEGEERLLAEALDDQAGESGYNPFVAHLRLAPVRTTPGDELRLRSTNLNDVMYSVMVFHPPSEYMSFVELSLASDGPEVGLVDGAPVVDSPCGEGLEIGGGQEAFEPFPSPGTAPMELGPQGSWMIFFSLRATGLDGGDPDDALAPGNPLVEVRARLESAGAFVGQLTQRLGFSPAAGALEAPGLILTLDPGLRVANLDGQAVRVDAVVTDREGERVCAHRTIYPSIPR